MHTVPVLLDIAEPGSTTLASRAESRPRSVIRGLTPAANAILDNVSARSPLSPTSPGRSASQPTSACGQARSGMQKGDMGCSSWLDWL
jgi:hypothetical protein